MRSLAMAFAAASFLFACADGEPQTSTFGSTAPASTPTISETKSEALPAQPSVAPAPSEPKKEDAPVDAGAPATADDGPEWMKNCLPFVPCFPPDEPVSDSSDDCPPFDPICQTNAAIKYYESK